MLDDLAYSIQERYLLALARQEIEYLRRLYAKATDSLGMVDDASARDYGISTYHRIFTTDMHAKVTGAPSPLEARSPDGWVDIVTNALKDYETTQHLIGTQLVEFTNVSFSDDQIAAGDAHMTSYLHAWHAWPDRRLRLVLGTYIDKIRFTEGIGWQIYDMTLHHTSTEHRMLGDSA